VVIEYTGKKQMEPKNDLKKAIEYIKSKSDFHCFKIEERGNGGFILSTSFLIITFYMMIDFDEEGFKTEDVDLYEILDRTFQLIEKEDELRDMIEEYGSHYIGLSKEFEL